MAISKKQTHAHTATFTLLLSLPFLAATPVHHFIATFAHFLMLALSFSACLSGLFVLYSLHLSFSSHSADHCLNGKLMHVKMEMCKAIEKGRLRMAMENTFLSPLASEDSTFLTWIDHTPFLVNSELNHLQLMNVSVVNSLAWLVQLPIQAQVPVLLKKVNVNIWRSFITNSVQIQCRQKQTNTFFMRIVPAGYENASPNVSHIGNEFEMTRWVETSDQSWEKSASEWWSQEIVNKG